MKHLLILSTATLALAACAPSNIAVRNPETGEVKHCARGWWGTVSTMEECAKLHESVGFVRVDPTIPEQPGKPVPPKPAAAEPPQPVRTFGTPGAGTALPPLQPMPIPSEPVPPIGSIPPARPAAPSPFDMNDDQLDNYNPNIPQ